MRLILECMHGLGDNAYQRVVARACLLQGWEVWVRTSWPQLWWDLPVKILRTETGLRTQAANISKWEGTYDANPESPYERRHLRYGTADFSRGMPITSALMDNAGFTPGPVDFTYIAKPEWIEWANSVKPKDRPLALVHPPTVRTEWPNAARGNEPLYMQQLVDQHQEFEWWELGWLKEPEEVRYGAPLTGVARSMMHGQFTTEQLIGLMAVADVIVTSVGFMLPLGIALRTPTVCLYGGDVPDRLLVEPWMVEGSGGSPYRAVEPKPMCECGVTSRHTGDNPPCNKKLDPREVEAAFRDVACRQLLKWEGEYGYYPVHVNGQYNKEYFHKYENYEGTELGKKLNNFRVDILHRHFPGIEGILLDVGPGSCQFVKSTKALGIDINPATIEKLRYLGRLAEKVEEVDVATFWDSLEHIPSLELDALLHKIRRGVVVTLPIFEDGNHVLGSKHFRPDEHFHYWTEKGFVKFMETYGFRLQTKTDAEAKLGREGVMTYVFNR